MGEGGVRGGRGLGEGGGGGREEGWLGGVHYRGLIHPKQSDQGCRKYR